MAQQVTQGGTTTTTVYVGDVEEISTSGSTREDAAEGGEEDAIGGLPARTVDLTLEDMELVTEGAWCRSCVWRTGSRGARC